jgi:transposase
MEYVLVLLTEVCYPEGRKRHEKKAMVHFDNAPIHNTQGIQEHLANVGFIRMEQPPYIPDPAPCDSFLFGAMKRNSSGQYFESVEGLLLALEAFLGGLSANFLQKVFPEWERQLQAC